MPQQNLPLIMAELLAAGVLISHGAKAFAGSFGGGSGQQQTEDLGQPAVGSPNGPAAIPGGSTGQNVLRAIGELVHAAPAYVWGGGHGTSALLGADCSGAVSYVLNRAGLLKGSLTSTGFMSYGDAGPGQTVSIYANATHVLMSVKDTNGDVHFFGTSGFGHPDAKNGTGANWFTVDPTPQYLSGFTVRHPPGL